MKNKNTLVILLLPHPMLAQFPPDKPLDYYLLIQINLSNATQRFQEAKALLPLPVFVRFVETVKEKMSIYCTWKVTLQWFKLDCRALFQNRINSGRKNRLEHGSNSQKIRMKLTMSFWF